MNIHISYMLPWLTTCDQSSVFPSKVLLTAILKYHLSCILTIDLKAQCSLNMYIIFNKAQRARILKKYKTYCVSFLACLSFFHTDLQVSVEVSDLKRLCVYFLTWIHIDSQSNAEHNNKCRPILLRCKDNVHLVLTSLCFLWCIRMFFRGK